MFSKYLSIIHITIAQFLSYRLSFLLWRVRAVINLILLFFLWTAVFTGKAKILTYTHDQIITYVLLIILLNTLVFSTRTADISSEILNGSIINYLLKPFSFFQYVLTREFTDKLVNTGFSIVETILFLAILRPTFFVQTDLVSIVFTVFTICIGLYISYCISLLLSLLAFWTSDVWAPRFLYFVLVSLLAGIYFPLDIMPKFIYQLFLLTPFPYMVFLPTKIYLHGYTSEFIFPILVSIVWCAILFWIVLLTWKKGMKDFSFFGR